MRACRTCGIALDGRIKRPRTILVNFDGNVSAGGVYCVEHYDKVRDRILGVLAEFDDTAQRHAAGVALRGGGA